MFYVYKKFGPDGTPCYVGKGHGNRYRDNGSRNADLRAMIAAGGVTTKIVKRGLTEVAALHLERSMIRAMGLARDGGILLNRTIGGQGVSGLRHSEETKRRISKNKKVHFANPESRVKTSEATKAAMARPETRSKVSEAQKKRFADLEERTAAANRRLGSKHPDETRAKIGQSHTGQKRSAEARAKMSSWQVGRKMSIEARAKMSAAAKKRFLDPAERSKATRKNTFVSAETRTKLSAAAKAQWARLKGE